MLIDFIPAKSKVLYQRISDSILTFTSNNNLSFRLSKDKRRNIYLDSMTGGEDVYLCIKLLKENKKYLVDNNLIIYHKPRKNIKGLLKQFFKYGNFSTDALNNLNLNKFEIFYNLSIESDDYRFFMKKNVLIKGLLYFSHFTLHQISILLLILFTNQYITFFFILTTILLFLKEISIFICEGPLKGTQLFLVNYLVNWSFSLGALFKSIRTRTLFVPPQLRKSKYTLDANYRVFGLYKIKKDAAKELIEIVNKTKTESSCCKFIDGNTLRINNKFGVFILKRINLIVPLYILRDFYYIKD